ncbi:MAG: VWA domain-containing protein [Verrucomicrobia bacterium]|nr:VWA domain-containing protein [Verrucomicrobiota bacterium]
MSFLAPLFLLGALGVVLPIVFHLVRRSSRQKTTFSSLMFLSPSPPRITRRTRLEQLLLLLLRCLVLGLLAAAFARPFLRRALPLEARSAPNRQVVVLVDTSASMQRTGYWEEARRQVEAVVTSLTAADQLALLAFDRQIDTRLSFHDWNAAAPGDRAALARERLAAMRPGWAATGLGAGLRAAAELLAEEGTPLETERRIALISDLQAGAELDDLLAYEWPRGVALDVRPVRAREHTNAGLHGLAQATDGVEPSAGRLLRVQVVNAADAAREQFELVWEPPTAGSNQTVYVPAGQSRVVNLPEPPADVTAARVVLRGDDEAFDNVFHWLRPATAEVPIWFVGPAAADDPAGMLYYLQRVFQPSPACHFEVRAWSPEGPAPTTGEPEPRLLILTETPGADWTARAQRRLAEGATVLYVLSNAAGEAPLRALSGEEELALSEATVGDYAMVGRLDFTHPLLGAFRDARYSDFTGIHFWRHRRVTVATPGDARVVAAFENGDPALLEWSRGSGRLLVLTAGWHPADSQLARSSKFVPLLYSILDQAGGLQLARRQFLVGDEVELESLLDTVPAGPIAVRAPDGTPVTLPAGSKTFRATAQPGVYTVLATDPPVRFAVNLDPAESRTAPFGVDELERRGVRLASSRPPAPAALAAARQRAGEVELEGRQKLWRWLIVAALVVLLAELWLASRVAPRNGSNTVNAT